MLEEHGGDIILRCLWPGIGLTVAAVDGDAADNLQTEMLFTDNVDDLAELLCGSGKAAHFQRDDRVARGYLWTEKAENSR